MNVPWQWHENPALAQWVNTQRKKYKDLTDGKKNNLSEEQIDKLNSIGFKWSTGGKGRYQNSWEQLSKRARTEVESSLQNMRTENESSIQLKTAAAPGLFEPTARSVSSANSSFSLTNEEKDPAKSILARAAQPRTTMNKMDGYLHRGGPIINEQVTSQQQAIASIAIPPQDIQQYLLQQQMMQQPQHYQQMIQQQMIQQQMMQQQDPSVALSTQQAALQQVLLYNQQLEHFIQQHPSVASGAQQASTQLQPDQLLQQPSRVDPSAQQASTQTLQHLLASNQQVIQPPPGVAVGSQQVPAQALEQLLSNYQAGVEQVLPAEAAAFSQPQADEPGVDE